MRIRLYSIKDLAFARHLMLAASALVMGGCASTGQTADASADEVLPVHASPIDPFEGFNRAMYSFNMSLDKYLFKPVSDGYKFITPDLVETGVSNFFSNLRGINVVLNDVLQGKLTQAGSDAGRFLANTTIGVAGLIDVATDLGMPHNNEDFGQTLAVWGFEDSTYLVLPVMGPTTIRDGSGGIFDRAANPSTYMPFVGVLEGISERANADGALHFINEAALDPYVFTRESFLQHRRHLINDGKNDSSHFDIDAVVEESIDADAGDARLSPAVAEFSEINNDVQVATTEAVDAIAPPSTPFDDMVKSFEEAMLKMDRYGDALKNARRI